jgi:CIC family chloride channel protein
VTGDEAAGATRTRPTARILTSVRTAPYIRKWLILGTLIGVVAGLGAVVFFEGLTLATRLLLTDVGGYTPARTAGEGGFRLASGFSRPWAIPLVVGGGALLAGLLVFGLAPEAEGHGTDAAIKAVHTNPKGVRPRVIVVKLVASVLTIGSGGSGGREGPTAQISSGFGSVLAKKLNLTPADSRICVAAGIASGIGAIFRAPFGGALLGVELLYTNDVEIEALMPSVVATVVGYGVFCWITGSFTPVFGYHNGAEVRHAWELILFVVVGLGCGAVGKIYTLSFYWLTDRFNAWRIPRGVKPAVAGLVVGAIGLAIPGVLGTGYGELQLQLNLHQLMAMPLWIVVLLPFAKLLATGLSIGSGGSGGIFGPGMVVGGATGALLWRLGHLIGLAQHDQVAFVIVGMAACFAAIAHAPIAVLVMVAEMTGSLALLPAAMVAIAFSSLVVGDTTIYRSQLRRRSDSLAHRFGFGLPEAGAVPVTTLMSASPLILSAETTAAVALERIRTAGVPGAPVVNDDGAFLGTVESAGLASTVREDPRSPVGSMADGAAMTLPAEAGLDAAIDALPASAGGWVPVLDDDMRVLGIVTSANLAKGWQQTMQRSVHRLTEAARSSTVVEGEIIEGRGGAGCPVADLDLPAGAILVSVVRGGNVMVPTSVDHLEVGDMVAVVARAGDAGLVREALGLPLPPPTPTQPSGLTGGNGSNARRATSSTRPPPA